MPLARLHAPFEHPDWIFEPKMDGFRAVLYLDGGSARLISRKGNTFKSFPQLTLALATALPVKNAILDGEIVHVGPEWQAAVLRAYAAPESSALFCIRLAVG